MSEIPTRVLRDQLGEKLARAAGVDFAAPIVERKVEAEKEPPLRRAERHGEPQTKRRGDDKKPGKRGERSQEKRLPGRPLRGEGRRDTYDARDEARSRRGSRDSGSRKPGRSRRGK